jgi:hypothetical protein
MTTILTAEEQLEHDTIKLTRNILNETSRKAWFALLREVEAGRMTATPELTKFIKNYERLVKNKIKCAVAKLPK